jgi:hypothetical protein
MEGMIGRAQLRQRCQFHYWVNFIIKSVFLNAAYRYTTTMLTEPPCIQCSWWCICLEWKCLMHFLFQLWTVQHVQHPMCENWRLQICIWKFVLVLCSLFMVMAKHVVNGELSCDQRWSVMRSTASCQQCGWLCPVIPRHLPLSWLCNVVPAVTSYRNNVREWPWIRWWRHTTLVTSRGYERKSVLLGELMWSDYKTLPKASFWQFLKCQREKKPGPG